MANKKVTDLTAITTAPVSGVMHFIDTTDTSQNAAGSSFKVTKADLLKENTAAILVNTAKVGITNTQATAITVNTAKVGYTDTLVAAAPSVVANTAKVGITSSQATAIITNNAKVGFTDALVNTSPSVVANTAKVGITTAEASAIVVNTAKVGITNAQATAITNNTSDILLRQLKSDIATTVSNANTTNPVTGKAITDFESFNLEGRLYNKVSKRLLTESDNLDLVGNFTGNKVNTLTTNVFSHPKIKLKDTSKNFKALGWRSANFASSAGFSKTFNFSLAEYVVGDVINVRFFLRRVGLRGDTNSVAKKYLTIGTNTITLLVANTETTITDVGDNYNKYITRHVLTASDITQGVVTSVDLIYYASSTPTTDSLEVAGMEVYFNDANLFALKVDEISTDVTGLVPTINNSKGKIVSNVTDTMVAIGNNTNPFITASVTTAKLAGLTAVDENTNIYKGVGWKSTSFSSWAGYKVDLSTVSLSSLGSVLGDKLKAIYYIRNVIVTQKQATNGLFIGTNKIETTTGTEVTITDAGGGWFKYELLHNITASDITQNGFLRFEWSAYGAAVSGDLAAQSIEITTPLIYINDLNLYGYFNEQTKKAINTRVLDLTTRERRWQNSNWYVSGDSITAYNNYQEKVKTQCEILSIVNDGIPGQQLGTMADRMTSGNLADVDLITIFGGTNDYGGNKALGTINDAKTVNTFYGNIKNVIDKIQVLKPTAQLVFITPLKRGTFQTQPVYPAANGAGFFLPQYAQAIKEVCDLFSIPVLDLYSVGGFNEYTLTSFTVDNLHPNEAGFVMLSKKISAFLENL